MKIVFIAPFGIRPKGTVPARMLPLAAELQNLGHSVTIVAPPYTNPEDSGKVETVGGVLIRNVKLGPSLKIAAAAALARRLYRTAMSEEPDLIHLFKPKGYGGLAAAALLLLSRMGRRLPPLFVDADDWEGKGGMNALHGYSLLERMVFRLQEQWLPPSAAGVTVASRTLQTLVWGMGVPDGNVLYLPNCVTDRPPGNGAKVRSRLGIPDDVPVLLLYTRFFEFSQEKLHYLFTEICRNVPSVRFLVIGRGRGNEEELLVRAGGAAGFLHALIMAGWVEPLEIADYLAAGDVAVYPFKDSLVNRAKCPAKLTELLLSGIPVVADDVGQLPEYVRSGISGFLCRPDDWREMAGKTVDLLLDRGKRLQMGKSGRAYLLENFSWKDAAVNLEKFYMDKLPSSQKQEASV